MDQTNEENFTKIAVTIEETSCERLNGQDE